ncbi:MAG: extracellular solute-binding protein [Endomicrobiaceae bacterium]|nr:extracellular solute-binding protein [Endomicrobiaceae bacterium]MDD3923088.1 extracellular solute-binding protein [Endomicrobiaceae bacterium]MDD5101575.1 extracellular solute-binding protein [Endomicrobiaceae bacterium]
MARGRFFVFVKVFFFCLFMVISSGCGKKESAKNDDSAIKVWHWMTDRQAAFDKLAEQYYNETGVKVVFETYAPTDVYKNKITAAASGQLLPDIFNPLSDKRELASYIKAGFIANLTTEMNAGWKDVFFEKSLVQNMFDENNEWGVEPGYYGVPLDVSSLMIYYNKDLFTQAGLDANNPPKTWKDFIEAGKKLRAAGIQPFVSGFGESWLIGSFAASYQWNLFGKQGIIDTIEGKLSYTDPRWVRIFGLFNEMKENKMFASGIVTMINKDAERTFATGKAAMALNGSWGVNVYKSMNSSLQYGIMYPPALSDAKYPLLVFGGDGSSMFVNAMSPKKDKAIAFLKWFTQRQQQSFLAKETLNIPSNKESAQDLPEILKDFSKSINHTFENLPMIESWQVTNYINTNLQSVIIGEKTPQLAAEEVQAEKQRQMKVRK